MIDGITLGVLSWLSILLSWWHLPQWLKNITKRHPVVSDIAAGGLTFFFLTSISKSLIAVIGSIVCGLLVNLSIIIGKLLNDTSGSNSSPRD